MCWPEDLSDNMPGNEKAVAGWVTGHLILSVCRTRRQSLCGLIFVNNNLTPSLAVRQENRPMPSRTYHYYQVKYMLSAKSPRLKRFVYWIFPIAWQVLRLEDIGQNEGFANVCKTKLVAKKCMFELLVWSAHHNCHGSQYRLSQASCVHMTTWQSLTCFIDELNW